MKIGLIINPSLVKFNKINSKSSIKFIIDFCNTYCHKIITLHKNINLTVDKIQNDENELNHINDKQSHWFMHQPYNLSDSYKVMGSGANLIIKTEFNKYDNIFIFGCYAENMIKNVAINIINWNVIPTIYLPGIGFLNSDKKVETIKALKQTGAIIRTHL